ncbi:hypothetical protein AO367_1148 [Moraxella catarrhalis]|uniref:Uncharacterized protein n=1 Tax=Moraxella catarrhalis TaxID=480 RepID=A0AB36DRA1_MORCA|nr:hypothetical protein AO380_1162 [Moraxella catarrhalis]OAV28006.1 hypothetical protein AO370_0169 [Moraxella catarrhalis]OAV30554.1 hypothetical protein AO367_1148 [Moraxella catarrhalis]
MPTLDNILLSFHKIKFNIIYDEKRLNFIFVVNTTGKYTLIPKGKN